MRRLGQQGIEHAIAHPQCLRPRRRCQLVRRLRIGREQRRRLCVIGERQIDVLRVIAERGVRKT